MPLAPLQRAAPSGVKFVPRFVSDGELAACFRRADLVVLPYLHTDRLDFSGVLATALAFARPAVISDVGGFEEIAAAGAARLVAPGDPPGLAASLAELVGDDGERRRLAEGARRLADGPYSWAEAARRTMALYLELSA
jgi:glycosyltransferase involved in cell wall biosynthesis